ncbi:uncharacterized protein LOC131935477 [Physella acuta]|uniref:uncharacterized protein LOC131935477 n=1 Tax=Physella acuta TaxID=109671 RepID=UPI0027DDEA55|nr:uncharacterized protein LOC131935477 [Physella acuta]
MITRVVAVLCVCFFACLHAECCKNQHICLTTFIKSEETDDGICRGINEYLKCVVNLENAEADEIKYILGRLQREPGLFTHNCTVDTELTLFLNLPPVYLSSVQPMKIPNSYPSTTNVCLNTYLDTLGTYSNTPTLICQSLLTFFHCTQSTLLAPPEEVREAMAVFTEELSRFQLRCDLRSELINTACKTTTDKCVVAYFDNILQSKFKDEPIWTCPYLQYFTQCLAQTTCSIDVVTDLMKLVGKFETHRTGYDCDTLKATEIISKKPVIRRLAEIISGPYQVALSETVNILVQD